MVRKTIESRDDPKMLVKFNSMDDEYIQWNVDDG